MSFWEGMARLFDFPGRMHNTRRPRASAAEALERDWQRVNDDLHSVLAKLDRDMRESRSRAVPSTPGQRG